MSFEPRGAWTAIYTPFTSSGEVDQPALEALIDRQASSGVGVVACGTTGETPTLTTEEYDLVVRTAVRVAGGRVPVIAGTGSNSTRVTLETTRLAKDLGVDGALVVTPYYNKPPAAGQLAHFRAVADEGGLPIMLYNVPGRTGTKMTAETILTLAEHPQVLAVKEASGDMDLFGDLIAGAPAGFVVLSGDDALTAPAMLLGAGGVVSVAANVIPRTIARLVGAGASGDVEGLAALQEELMPLFSALFLTSNPIPLKAAAASMGHATASVRLPLVEEALDDEMARALEVALERALALEGAPS
jgi:4-hydroxy-tetrahydrodipicolinate synthase